MILIDDRLCLDALAGRTVDSTEPDDIVATTWGFHFRLLRALADDRVVGSLTRAASADVMARAAAPPASRLVVLDPKDSTALAAALAARHGLDLLASELVATAKAHACRVVLSAGNVGRRWPRFSCQRVSRCTSSDEHPHESP